MELVGKWYNDTLYKCSKIIWHQYKESIKSGIRGFVFYGTPGNGKTTLAKKIVEDLPGEKPLENNMIFKDCADLAHYRYGETEKEIRKVFEMGRNKANKPVIYIFDDADGLFLTRDFGPKLDAWYIGQLNVLFHELDKMDTSNEFVILTTNRIDLLDKALIDRLYSIEFPNPPKSVLGLATIELALNTLNMKKSIVNKIKNVVQEDEKVKTFRDMERIVYEMYIESIESSEELNEN
ncbi:MAG: ATP-binding protein [Promethearchaeota archaeon]